MITKKVSLQQIILNMRNCYSIFLLLFFTLVNAQNPADIDITFNNKPNKVFVNRTVNQCITQSDGKVIMVGDFDGYFLGSGGGEFVKCKYKILRLNSDQTIDATFNLTIPAADNMPLPFVKSAGIQSSGKIIAVIANYPYPGGGTYYYPVMVRFNLNGSLDTTFPVFSYDSSGTYLKVLSNDNIIYQNHPYLKRLNANGSEDQSFIPTYVDSRNFNIVSDGSIYTTDYFGGYIQKYSSNGVPDNVFNSNMTSTSFNCSVSTIDVQSDGKILIGGKFNRFNDTPVAAKQLLRLNPNGTLDTTFAGLGFVGLIPPPSIMNPVPCDNYDGVRSVKIQPDGKILVGGSFIKYGNSTVNSLVRLNSDGSIDTSFNIGTGLKSDVTSLVLQPNGDVWVLLNANGVNYTSSGAMNSYGEIVKTFNDFEVGLFLKLDTNGNLLNEQKNSNFPVKSMVKTNTSDIALLGESRLPYNRGIKLINNNGNPIFNSSLFSGFNYLPGYGNVCTRDMIVQPDGKMIVCGDFTKYNNIAANGLIRLNSDYTIDTSFNIGTGFTRSQVGLNASITTIALQTDGKILVSGYFEFFNGMPITNGIIRINSNGTLDSSFNCSDFASKIVVLADGKLMIAGNYIKRLNTDGSIDSGFNFSGYADDFAFQSDGKIIAGGQRFNPNGSLDTTFNDLNVYQSCLIIQNDDKILVGTPSDQYNPGKIFRFNSDGTPDETFNTGAGFNGAVRSLMIDAQGRILAAGDFTRYNGAWCNGVVRLLGADAYLIKGKNKYDSNTNGCDVNDINFPNMKYSLVSGTTNVSIISNTTGDYFIPLPPGTYTLTPVFENPSYLNVSPSSVTVNFPAQGSTVIQDFCITPNGSHPDLEVSLIPVTPARPGFQATYKLVYKNKGGQLSFGTVGLNFDDAVLNLTSASPAAATSATNVRTWNFTNLQPFETREITLKFNLNTPQQTPPLTGGSVLNYTVNITSPLTDETPNDNTFVLNQTVVNSFDPNDKTCLEGTTITPDKVGTYVHYVIRFENTGTYSAQNITVRDFIDTNKFDINTLVPVNGSHLFTTKISEGNKVEFVFENINLPFDDANNDGYVAFKIKTKPTLVSGDTFSNGAGIYFDYNSAITTNTYATTIQTLSNQDFSFANYFILYPNPVSDVLNINKKGEVEISSIHIYNVMGQLMMVIPNAKETTAVDVSNLASGNYFVKINSDKGTSNTKFIKR
jgi:uncharacterized delta-60 repeat protein